MFRQNGIYRIRPAAGSEVSIAIAGDACPRENNESYVQEHGREILEPIRPALDAADIRIIQWETVVSSTPNPIYKCGPHLRVAPETAHFLVDGKFDIALLANNHTGDHGPEGILSTLQVLHQLGIKTAGAGINSDDASKALHFEKNGLKFALINACEMEFGTALPDRAGSNAMQEYQLPVQIAAEKAAGNLVIVVIHGGNEYNPIPSPRMKNLYRAFAGAGASLVMNIHPHCPQGIEVYHDVPIVYSPGNFFFPGKSAFDPSNFWWSGYLPKFTFDAAGVNTVEITPYYFTSDPLRITPLIGAARQWFLDYIDKISDLLLTDGDRLYDIWCANKLGTMLNWIGNAPVAGLSADPENEEALKAFPSVRHMMTCQSHNELVRNIMLLVEQKRIKPLLKQLPELMELRTARFMEQQEKR